MNTESPAKSLLLFAINHGFLTSGTFPSPNPKVDIKLPASHACSPVDQRLGDDTLISKWLSQEKTTSGVDIRATLYELMYTSW